MSEINVFEQASRLKLRFQTTVGQLSVEDLWELPLQHQSRPNLDDLAKGLNRELKDVRNDESFVKPEVKGSELLELRFAIVKHIIDVKVLERDARQQQAKKAEEKQKLLALLDQKENQALESLSVDEIRARIAAL
jgi:hypothetical protein